MDKPAELMSDAELACALDTDKPAELLSDAELARALDEADAELARLETRRLRLVAAMDSSGYAERVGARDMVQYLEFRYRLDHSRAYRDVRLARALPKYPAVTAALPDVADVADDRDGEIPEVVLRPAQAEAIVTALEKVPTTVPVADLEFAEQELVRLARHLCPTDLRKAAEQSRDILDTDGPEPEEHKAAARESLTLTTADRGVKFKGYLANENAELFRTLIVTGARPHKTLDGERDPRSREKRQADALTTTLTLAATALDAGTPSPTMPRPTNKPASSPQAASPTADSIATDSTEAGSGSAGSTDTGSTETGSMAQASTAETTVDAPSGADVRADDGSGAAAGDGQQPGVAAGVAAGVVAGPSGGASAGAVAGVGGDVVPGFGAKANLTVTIDLEDLKAATADAIGHTVYSNGLSAATIRRLACDANVIPIVLGSNSEPLDVGRRERLVTKALRRALNTRDRGCVICNAPPVMCDAHHLISWIDGGHTKLDNLALVCRRDHTDLHHGHWTITITNGQVHVTRPTWADPPPRHPHKPPAHASGAPKPPGDHPTPAGLPDDPFRANESPGDHPTPAGLPDDPFRVNESPGDHPTPAGLPDDPFRVNESPGDHATPAGPSDDASWTHEPPDDAPWAPGRPGEYPTSGGPSDDASWTHEPPDDAPWAPGPPGEYPTPSGPSDDASRAHEPTGEHPMPSRLPEAASRVYKPSGERPTSSAFPEAASRVLEPPGERSTPDNSPPGASRVNRLLPEDSPAEHSWANHARADHLAPEGTRADRSRGDHSPTGNLQPNDSSADSSPGGDSVADRLLPETSRADHSAPGESRGSHPRAGGARVCDSSASGSRDATYLAIWGDDPPAERREESARRASDRTPFDPWGDTAEARPFDPWGDTAEVRPFDPWGDTAEAS